MYVKEDQRKKRYFPCTRFCIDNMGAVHQAPAPPFRGREKVCKISQKRREKPDLTL